MVFLLCTIVSFTSKFDCHDIYRIMPVLMVETNIITSIAAILTGTSCNISGNVCLDIQNRRHNVTSH